MRRIVRARAPHTPFMRAQGLALEPFLPQLFALCWCEGADRRGLRSPATQSLVLGSGGNPPGRARRRHTPPPTAHARAPPPAWRARWVGWAAGRGRVYRLSGECLCRGRGSCWVTVLRSLGRLQGRLRSRVQPSRFRTLRAPECGG